MKATERYVGKVAEMFRSDINIPFTYRNNVALTLQRVRGGIPTDDQAKELVNHITGAIVHSGHDCEGNGRWCPWCLSIVPASLIRCLRCNAIMISWLRVVWVRPALLTPKLSSMSLTTSWKRSTSGMNLM